MRLYGRCMHVTCTVLCCAVLCPCRPVAEAVVQEAVKAAEDAEKLGSSSGGRGLPQIERIRLNVHANQVSWSQLKQCIGCVHCSCAEALHSLGPAPAWLPVT